MTQIACLSSTADQAGLPLRFLPLSGPWWRSMRKPSMLEAARTAAAEVEARIEFIEASSSELGYQLANEPLPPCVP